LTRASILLIVSGMNALRNADGARWTAILVAGAFVFVTFASVGLFAGVGEANGERCLSCVGCDDGDCGDPNESPFTDHHCCLVSCMSHASLTLPTPTVSSAPVLSASTTWVKVEPLTPQVSEPPYHPPRC